MEDLSVERISLPNFQLEFSGSTELSSVAIGGKIVSVSDEFFAEAFHLLLVEPSILKKQYGPKGDLYDGWESRRHNPTYDWCIIKLGTAGTLSGFDIDTTHFNGNEAPRASVEALLSSEDPNAEDSRWIEILPKVDLGPSSRHLFKIPESARVNYVKLNIYPDGGVARFRVYGHIVPVWPKSLSESFDLAHVFAGGTVEAVSNQHYGVASNLILPGRGKDMGDGWETKRSRQVGHLDWVIIQLGAQGLLDYVEIDTANFMGNFPESCEMHAMNVAAIGDVAAQKAQLVGGEWTLILPRTKLGPHRRHFFHLENVSGRLYTHVRLTIYPDGGLKRIRVIGTRAEGADVGNAIHVDDTGVRSKLASNIPGTDGGLEASEDTQLAAGVGPPSQAEESLGPVTVIPALPLTPEAFSPFGCVVQGYADPNAAPRGTHLTFVNSGTATKFHKLAPVVSSYPPEMKATTGLSVFRAKPSVAWLRAGHQIKMLERHPYTSQAFIPMGSAGSLDIAGNALEEQGHAYLVIVAKTGEDGLPDLGSLRAFVANGAQGVSYNTSIWHHPTIVLEKPIDFTCVETQIGNGDSADCEVVDIDPSKGIFKVGINL